MKLWKDIVGREIQPGDYVFSCASSTAIAKFGYARYSERGNLMLDIVHQVGEVGGYSTSPKSSAAGTNVLVLISGDRITDPVMNIWEVD